jgi:hypothetical protein
VPVRGQRWLGPLGRRRSVPPLRPLALYMSGRELRQRGAVGEVAADRLNGGAVACRSPPHPFAQRWVEAAEQHRRGHPGGGRRPVEQALQARTQRQLSTGAGSASRPREATEYLAPAGRNANFIAPTQGRISRRHDGPTRRFSYASIIRVRCGDRRRALRLFGLSAQLFPVGLSRSSRRPTSSTRPEPGGWQGRKSRRGRVDQTSMPPSWSASASRIGEVYADRPHSDAATVSIGSARPSRIRTSAASCSMPARVAQRGQQPVDAGDRAGRAGDGDLRLDDSDQDAADQPPGVRGFPGTAAATSSTTTRASPAMNATATICACCTSP